MRRPLVNKSVSPPTLRHDQPPRAERTRTAHGRSQTGGHGRTTIASSRSPIGTHAHDVDERMRPTAQKDVVGSLRRGPATAMLPSSVTEVAIPES